MNEQNVNIRQEEMLGLNCEVQFDNKKSVDFDLTISSNGNEIRSGVVPNYPSIMKFLSDKRNFDIVYKRYGFAFRDYLNLINHIKEICAVKERNKYIKKYKKYKKLCQVLLVLSIILLLVILGEILF